jgi:hypothetical protein
VHPTNLAENKSIPQDVGIVTCGMKFFQLDLYCFLKDRSLQARSGSCHHCRLIYPVENTWYRGEYVGLEDLSIFKETKGVARKIPNLSTNSDGDHFEKTLRKFRSKLGYSGTKYTYFIDVGQREIGHENKIPCIFPLDLKPIKVGLNGQCKVSVSQKNTYNPN